MRENCRIRVEISFCRIAREKGIKSEKANSKSKWGRTSSSSRGKNFPQHALWTIRISVYPKRRGVGRSGTMKKKEPEKPGKCRDGPSQREMDGKKSSSSSPKKTTPTGSENCGRRGEGDLSSRKIRTMRSDAVTRRGGI